LFPWQATHIAEARSERSDELMFYVGVGFRKISYNCHINKIQLI